MKCTFAQFVLATGILMLGNWFGTPAFGQTVPTPTTQDEFSLELPGPERLFHLQSEAAARQDIRAAGQKKGVLNVTFPLDAQPFAKTIDFTQTAPPLMLMLPPGRVCYRTLYYQDIRTERCLESWGVVEPLRSAFLFYGKTLILPGMVFAVRPCQYQSWVYPYVLSGR